MDFSRHVSLELKPSEALFSSSMSSSCFVERRFDSIAWSCSTSTGRPEVKIQGSIEGEIQSHSDINLQVNIKGFIQVNIQDTWTHPLLRNMLFSCFPFLTHYPTFVCTIVRSESSCNEVVFFIHLAFWRIWNKSQSCFDHRFHSGSCKLTINGSAKHQASGRANVGGYIHRLGINHLRGPKRGKSRKSRLISLGPHHQTNSGWWLTYPSEKYESQLGWLFPIYIYIWENNTCSIKFMFQTTNQN